MTGDKPLFLIDSNILIYAYEEEASHKKQIAKKILSQAFAKKESYAVSIQNLAEFACAYLTKGKGDMRRLQKSIKGISRHENFIKISYTQQTITHAMEIITNSKNPFWDALIAATMLENNIRHIYTENTSDFANTGITAINPFAKHTPNK